MPKEKTSRNSKPKLTYQPPKLVALSKCDTGLGANNCRSGSGAAKKCNTGFRVA